LASAVPVFVVGLPRSGTTLVEQILAAHPRVEGTGERIIVNELLRELERRQPYPESVPDLTEAERKDLGTRYVEQLVKGLPAPDPVRVIDKMPYNFLHLGFIRLILPAATVIHCRRDPLDVCLSNFFQYFPNSSVDFSSDLEELGRFHQLYSRLMDHWRQVLPDDFLIDVEYEALIDHSEAVVRSLLAALDLPWDDACLDFHRSDRAVGSVSAWQVRQPMYRRSIGRWRNYEAHLSPLIRALGRDGGQSSR
jgi:hypothetical protein